MPGAEDLERTIREAHAEWTEPVVDREIFGTSDPQAIAEGIDVFCRAELGSAIARARFYRVSVGCVAGVELDDGRGVVVKVHRGRREPAYLETCFAIRRQLADSGFPCPRPIAGPLHLGDAWATAERLEDVGSAADAHEPRIRRAIAATLAELVALARPFTSDPALHGAWFTSIPQGRIYPKPHSPLFDFEATRAGAEWIDALAARARERRHAARGEKVVGHFDWRVEHLRFEGERVVTSFDWDSLHSELETVLVGATAHAFTADWQREDIARVPSLEEMRAFVADYEAARGRSFTGEERATIGASCVYSLAYTARCNHALGALERGENGDFRPLLRSSADELLARGI